MHVSPLIVSLDGPAGSGKSTLAKRLAARFDWSYLDSGAIYRTLTLGSIEEGIAPSDETGLIQLAGRQHLKMRVRPEGLEVLLDGRDVSQAIRLPEVTERVSEVSAHPGVREAVLDSQRRFAEQVSGLVAEGRDMGTVVFPEADLKVFLVASLEARAERRHAEQVGKGIDQSFESVLEALAERDRRDGSRDVAPLVAAPDALEVETTRLSIEEVLALLIDLVEQASERLARTHRIANGSNK